MESPYPGTGEEEAFCNHMRAAVVAERERCAKITLSQACEKQNCDICCHETARKIAAAIREVTK